MNTVSTVTSDAAEDSSNTPVQALLTQSQATFEKAKTAIEKYENGSQVVSLNKRQADAKAQLKLAAEFLGLGIGTTQQIADKVIREGVENAELDEEKLAEFRTRMGVRARMDAETNALIIEDQTLEDAEQELEKTIASGEEKISQLEKAHAVLNPVLRKELTDFVESMRKLQESKIILDALGISMDELFRLESEACKIRNKLDEQNNTNVSPSEKEKRKSSSAAKAQELNTHAQQHKNSADSAAQRHSFKKTLLSLRLTGNVIAAIELRGMDSVVSEIGEKKKRVTEILKRLNAYLTTTDTADKAIIKKVNTDSRLVDEGIHFSGLRNIRFTTPTALRKQQVKTLNSLVEELQDLRQALQNELNVVAHYANSKSESPQKKTDLMNEQELLMLQEEIDKLYSRIDDIETDRDIHAASTTSRYKELVAQASSALDTLAKKLRSTDDNTALKPEFADYYDYLPEGLIKLLQEHSKLGSEAVVTSRTESDVQEVLEDCLNAINGAHLASQIEDDTRAAQEKVSQAESAYFNAYIRAVATKAAKNYHTAQRKLAEISANVERAGEEVADEMFELGQQLSKIMAGVHQKIYGVHTFTDTLRDAYATLHRIASTLKMVGIPPSALLRDDNVRDVMALIAAAPQTSMIDGDSTALEYVLPVISHPSAKDFLSKKGADSESDMPFVSETLLEDTERFPAAYSTDGLQMCVSAVVGAERNKLKNSMQMVQDLNEFLTLKKVEIGETISEVSTGLASSFEDLMVKAVDNHRRLKSLEGKLETLNQKVETAESELSEAKAFTTSPAFLTQTQSVITGDDSRLAASENLYLRTLSHYENLTDRSIALQTELSQWNTPDYLSHITGDQRQEEINSRQAMLADIEAQLDQTVVNKAKYDAYKQTEATALELLSQENIKTIKESTDHRDAMVAQRDEYLAQYQAAQAQTITLASIVARTGGMLKQVSTARQLSRLIVDAKLDDLGDCTLFSGSLLHILSQISTPTRSLEDRPYAKFQEALDFLKSSVVEPKLKNIPLSGSWLAPEVDMTGIDLSPAADGLHTAVSAQAGVMTKAIEDGQVVVNPLFITAQQLGNEES